jgi:hypothetical protein
MSQRTLAGVTTSPVAVTAGVAGNSVSITQTPATAGAPFKVYDQNQNLLANSPIVGQNGSYTWTALTTGPAFTPGQIVGYVATYSGTANFILSDTSPLLYVDPPSGEAFSAAGAITLKSGRAILTGATATAYTLAAPTAGVDDFKELTLVNQSGQAHTVTTPALAINGADDTMTFAATVGLTGVLRSYQGGFYFTATTGITLSEV